MITEFENSSVEPFCSGTQGLQLSLGLCDIDVEVSYPLNTDLEIKEFLQEIISPCQEV
jgi:hypothetical protein